MVSVDVNNLKVVKYPDPILHTPAAQVTGFGASLNELAEQMYKLMYQTHGVGLAGPQVGVGLMIFVANPDGQPSSNQKAYVNPVILEKDGEDITDEGCLSLPGLNCRIKRATKVKIRYQDLEGNLFEEAARGLLARIFQHETDHLLGVLISDKMSTVARLANRRLLKDLEEEHARPR